MKLQEAVMCLDCETIRHYQEKICPVCASQASAYIVEWITPRTMPVGNHKQRRDFRTVRPGRNP